MRMPKGPSKFRQSPLHKQTPEELKARAEAQFQFRTEQKVMGPLAVREYRAAEQKQRDLTLKLRAERLARKAADEK
jgi:hypothetical protein